MTDPMAPPPPPMPPAPPQSSSTMKWVLGCGAGCLILIIIAALAIFGGGYYLVTNVAPKGVSSAYQQMKTQGQVPAEHQAKYDRLVELGTGSDASFSATAMVGAIVTQTLPDGSVSEEDLAAVDEALAILEASPNMSTTQLQEFFAKFPQFQNMQNRFPVTPPADEAEPPVDETTPEPAPEAAPEAMPEPAPEAAPEVAPEAAPEAAPETAPAPGNE